MSYTEWKDKTDAFKKIDVRGIQGNFFQGIKKRAATLESEHRKFQFRDRSVHVVCSI